jgi:transposase-like protein
MNSLTQILEKEVEEVGIEEPQTLEEFMDSVEDELRYFTRLLIQTFVEDEFRAYIGADYYERTEEREDWRNGYQRPKKVLTRLGLIKGIKVPRARTSGFKSKILKRWQRREKRIAQIVQQLFIRGISTRKIKKLSQILWGTDLSPSQVSSLNSQIKQELTLWLNRKLTKKFSYLFLDGINLKLKRGTVSSEALLCVVGLTDRGEKEFLGFMLGGRESQKSWENALLHFIRCGLNPKSVKLVISDGCPGLLKAINTLFPDASHQRCLFHKMRNLSNKCPQQEWPIIKAKLQRIYYAPNEWEAKRLKEEFIDEYDQIFPKLTSCLEKDFENCITHKKHPFRRWSHIRTTNLIERTFKEFRRRINSMEIFPNEASCIRIMYQLAKLQNENWEGKPFKNF